MDSDRVKLHKSRLKILSVNSEDNGVYSCEASNQAGQAKSLQNFILSVPGVFDFVNFFIFLAIWCIKKMFWKDFKSGILQFAVLCFSFLQLLLFLSFWHKTDICTEACLVNLKPPSH